MRKFSNHQENQNKDVQKCLEAIAIAECMSFISFIQDSLQSSDEVTPFIQLSVKKKNYCDCLENLEVPVVLVNAARMKVNLLKLNSNLETT